MPVTIQHTDFPVEKDSIKKLWQNTMRVTSMADDDIVVRVVSEQEIKELNKNYRGKEAPTNVLTFSYPPEHDIALCLEVAEKESHDYGLSLRDYVAWLLAHAFLHVAEIDHERSNEEEQRMRQYEKEILESSGFKRPDLY